jgi:hypothetical protein
MLLLLIPAVLWLRPATDTPRQGIDFRAITSDPGYEALPSLASDANRVAYVNWLSPGTAQERIVYEH